MQSDSGLWNDVICLPSRFLWISVLKISNLLCNLGLPSLAVFSSPEPKARVSYCHSALSVVRPSVVRPSVVRPSGVNFHIFDFSSETAERNSTKLDRKQVLNALYQDCVFRADRKNKMAALASDWLRHFRLLLWNHWTDSMKLDRKQDLHALYQVCVFRANPKNNMAALASDWLRHFRLLLWNCWTEFSETCQEARSQCPLPSLCFSGRSEKQDGRPGLWLAETFSTSPLKPMNGIQRNLTGSKISTPSTKFVFLEPIRKTRWPPWPLIGWDIFDFFSENHWTEFNETWQEARSPRPLPSLCFSGRSEKQDGRPGLWLAETFLTSPLKLLNGIQRNLTGSKISTPSTKFVFIGSIRKTRWPPWPLIGWDIFDFSSEAAEWNSTKLDRKQDLKALYQVCVFRADWKNKMAILASDWPRHFRLLCRNRWMEFDETWQEARSQSPLPGLRFSSWSEKQDGHPGLWLAETFSTSPLKPLNWIQQNLIGSKISKPSTRFAFFQLIGKTRWPPGLWLAETFSTSL